jgi:hypothetical protein
MPCAVVNASYELTPDPIPAGHCAVDRKDLDLQTREDWSIRKNISSPGVARRVRANIANQFIEAQKGCVKENATTGLLR